ncbi:MAG: UDP-4-amino-4,6-dideoxy-N-acetyl-beta-L-altrosamine transaminase [Methanosarcinales archaeon]|nr:UDP-4-amino-4,6-dideoxy-N-acetyl-beta-L-altrosamine transaminase [Methanosarcinales archaeon]
MHTAHDEDIDLAINGGKPVRDALLPYGHQSIDEDDIRAVVETLRSDWITTGPKVAEFERAFADRVGSEYAVSFSSGTAALHGATFAANLGPGDEAITTPMTFCATANCVLYRGAKPVFADISPDTMNIDPEEIARCITSKTRAILPVDYAGHPADLDVIMELAERNRLLIIEDACHALGAEYKGKRVGSISHMTVFSFHPVKHITTGEGGMVTTDDPEIERKLRLFRNHGIEGDARQRQAKGQWYYEMIDLGYNYRLTDISCALGLSQLKRLDQNLSRRREIASTYRSEFEDIPGVILPTERSYVASAWHLYAIRLDFKSLNATRAEIFAALRAENIGVNVHYIPVHLHPYYRNLFGYKGGEYPVAEAAYESLISLPIFQGMTNGDVSDVIKALSKVLSHYAK